jgi:hypothetical protein
MGFFDWGSTPKEDALQDTYNKVSGLNTDTGTAFTGFNKPFAYGDKVKNLRTMQSNLIGDTSRRQAESLASQGFTKGSALAQASGNIAGSVADQFAGQDLGLMSQENIDAFNLAQAQNAQKQSQFQALLAKYGMQANLGNQLDDTTGWDYLGSAIGGAANIVSKFYNPFPTPKV